MRGKLGENFGKVREFCQFGKVGPVYLYDMTCFKYEIYIYCYVSIISNKHGYGLLSHKFRQILSRINFETKCRVATAQGKQGIWFLLFPDRENTGNFALTQGKILRHRENIFL